MMQPEPSPAPDLPAAESPYAGIAPKLYNSFGGGDRFHYVKLRQDLDDDAGFETNARKKKKRRPAIRMGSKAKSRFAAAVPGRMRLRFRLRRPKIRLGFVSALLSPIKLLKRLRDAYVSMMLSLAAKGDFSGAVLGNAVYVPSGQPCRSRVGGIDARKEDEILAYIDYLRRSGKLLPDPVMDR